MNKKEIIIPIVVAVIVACWVGYCSYNIAKASTVSESSISSNTGTTTTNTQSNTHTENATNTMVNKSQWNTF